MSAKPGGARGSGQVRRTSGPISCEWSAGMVGARHPKTGPAPTRYHVCIRSDLDSPAARTARIAGR